MYTKYGQILSIRSQALESQNSVKILQKKNKKTTDNNLKLDIVNVDVHTKFGQILLICSQDIDQKQIQTSIKCHNSIKILHNIYGYNPKLGFVNVDVHTKWSDSVYSFSRY